MAPIRITAFYHFSPLSEEDVETLRTQLFEFGKQNSMRGLVLLATEGINGTVCGKPDVIEKWKELIGETFSSIIWKDSEAGSLVFPRWLVKIRKEIVPLRDAETLPTENHRHVTPEEWNTMMEEGDAILLDARNFYETKIGMFEGAVDPKLTTFDDFKDFAKKAPIPKDKKVMMYCTGGIRCERAIHEMEKAGFSHVYQLKGGILAYLEKFPSGKFKGECFVFDRRVAVNQELKPSEHYSTCPHCGNPGDLAINCNECTAACVVCDDCTKDETKNTCSKNCRHWYGKKQSVVNA